MLDPEHKDISIDLDTYHAVMREWIDDCRNNGYRASSEMFLFEIKLACRHGNRIADARPDFHHETLNFAAEALFPHAELNMKPRVSLKFLYYCIPLLLLLVLSVQSSFPVIFLVRCWFSVSTQKQ